MHGTAAAARVVIGGRSFYNPRRDFAAARFASIKYMPPPTPMPRPFHSIEDARRLARRRMPRLLFDFVDGAVGRERAARLNRNALAKIQLQPRVLNDTTGRALDAALLGEEYALPFGVAPMGMCDLAWPGADRALAAAAARHAIPVCFSTAASTKLEDARDMAGQRAWFQLYVSDSAEAAWALVERAANAGYTHLVFTVDVPQISLRIRDLRNGFTLPFRIGPRQFFDFALHPRWSVETLLRGVPRVMNFEAAGAGKFVREAGRGAATWEFLERLRDRWRGRLIVKGVLSADDARRIARAGADAVYVSNHGGRQLDSAPPAGDALPAIRAALGRDYPLIFDSGVRGGEDVVKALALGADFVLLGRPWLYAIGAVGAEGPDNLVDILAREIDVTLAQIGRRRVGEVDETVLITPGRGVPADNAFSRTPR